MSRGGLALRGHCALEARESRLCGLLGGPRQRRKRGAEPCKVARCDPDVVCRADGERHVAEAPEQWQVEELGDHHGDDAASPVRRFIADDNDVVALASQRCGEHLGGAQRDLKSPIDDIVNDEVGLIAVEQPGAQVEAARSS